MASRDFGCVSLEELKRRREWFANRGPRNGWMQSESGPCCDECLMTNPINPLQALVGCRNPFQIASVCECHIPTREAVTAGILEVFDQLIRAAEQNTEPLAKTEPKEGTGER